MSTECGVVATWKPNIDAGLEWGPYQIYGIPPKGGADGTGAVRGFSLRRGGDRIGEYATVAKAMTAAEEDFQTWATMGLAHARSREPLGSRSTMRSRERKNE